jgi:hypothetical protein
MYLFYVISAFMVITGYLLTNGESQGESVKYEDMKSQATYMWIYHNAAIEFCQANGAYCNTARELTVPQVSPYLPTLTTSSGRLTSGRFTAVTDGTGGVITIHRDLQATQNEANYNEQRYVVSNALKEIVPDYVHAGAYDRPGRAVSNLQGDSRFVDISNSVGSMRADAPLIITDF